MFTYEMTIEVWRFVFGMAFSLVIGSSIGALYIIGKNRVELDRLRKLIDDREVIGAIIAMKHVHMILKIIAHKPQSQYQTVHLINDIFDSLAKRVARRDVSGIQDETLQWACYVIETYTLDPAMRREWDRTKEIIKANGVTLKIIESTHQHN